MSLVALIDYGSGNLRSAEKALARAANERGSGHTISVTADPAVTAKAERIVLPGVGAFADCMAGLQALPGMVETLRDAVLARGTPFLGICVGMQLLAEVGREFGDHPGLSWIKGDVVKMVPSDAALKIPHMGWNELAFIRPHPLFAGLAPGVHAYFVHSYVMRPAEPGHILATADYGGPFAAAVGRDNIVGTQFHPEKSQAVGLALLGNFLDWKP
ncbi:MAG: imidazole glycerol phosphate synthase subunit HisH [Alphaproteobacteria bacterium]|nr:imidazole glycerol phosphate synthase subunit HisH [Alphaproteobacteria bacterium]MDE2630128.1 imidazole glycerol phosphate synthase subunit HisH [Alphaproteobacteria bacterium]